jgi:hypothetical protein
VEYSYENSLSIPLIGTAWDVSFRAYANGSYGWGEVSTFKTYHSENTGVEVNLSNIGPGFDTVSYLYWADGGDPGRSALSCGRAAHLSSGGVGIGDL